MVNADACCLPLPWCKVAELFAVLFYAPPCLDVVRSKGEERKIEKLSSEKRRKLALGVLLVARLLGQLTMLT